MIDASPALMDVKVFWLALDTVEVAAPIAVSPWSIPYWLPGTERVRPQATDEFNDVELEMVAFLLAA